MIQIRRLTCRPAIKCRPGRSSPPGPTARIRLMSLYTLGLSHTTAPLDVREKVAFAPDVLADALRDLDRRAPRARSGDPVDLQSHRGVFPRRRAGAGRRAGSRTCTRCPSDALAPYVYTLPHDKAVPHAFRVASGLESMVLGEPQILGQMKQAVRTRRSRGLARPRAEPPVPAHLRGRQGRAHATPTSAARRSRWRPRRSSSPSASFRRSPTQRAAADRRRRDDRARGDALRRAASRSRSPSPTARSSAAAARRPLRRRGDHARPSCPSGCAQFDIIVTCTASTLPIIGKGMLERVVKAAPPPRRCSSSTSPCRATSRPRPRELDDVFLYSVDDLADDREGQPADPPRGGGRRPSA